MDPNTISLSADAKYIRTLKVQLKDARKSIIQSAKNILEPYIGKKVRIIFYEDNKKGPNKYCMFEGILRNIDKNGQINVQNYLADGVSWGYGIGIPCEDFHSIELI